MYSIWAFIERWVGGLSEILISFFGVLVCVLAIWAFWDRKIRAVDLLLLIGCSLSIIISSYAHIFVVGHFDIEKSLLQTFLVAVSVIAVVVVAFIRRNEIGFYRSLEGDSSLYDTTNGRSIRGTEIGVPIVIFLSLSAVITTGLLTPQVMIGDEVTHYYMLVHQAEDLTTPQFYADIPVGDTDEVVSRRYPHPFGWHYLGAVSYKLAGGTFTTVQLYHAIYLLQLLVVAYLLARDRDGVESRSALVYVLLIASLPLTLIFSVTFYQDVPLTAQILTAFYLLHRGRWFWASIFLALAISFKVTALLFYPSFFILLLYWQVKRTGWFKGFLAAIIACLILIGTTWQLGRAIVNYGDTYFYPLAQLEKILKKSKATLVSNFPVLSEKTGITNINTQLSSRPSQGVKKKEGKRPVIANHPGDLRVKENYLVYGGLVMWLVVLAGSIGALYCRFVGEPPPIRQRSSFWLFFVGGSYTIIAAWFLKTAPDARFFLPGLPFLLLPFVERSVRLPKPKLLITVIATLAILQGGLVLQKVYSLRSLTPDTKAAIHYLKQNLPTGYIFMYPEGNYRYFPVQHRWYLGYRLREFWRGNNDERIEMLREHEINTIVIKKNLIAQVDQNITNLGVYPTYFVEEISEDPRFVRVYENSSVLIYEVVR